jgi:glycosyltransferase involved in cell wall biosynthesis
MPSFVARSLGGGVDVDEPLISVCIPTYNGARYLAQCLESAVGQTYRHTEILINDDRSSDETRDIANRYAIKDNRVRLLENRHRLGLVGNWNRCVALARGEWVKFLFQDDLLESTCIERMLAAARISNSPIVACRRDIVFESGSGDVRRWYERHISLQGVFSDQRHVTAERFCEAVLDHMGLNFVGEPTVVLLSMAAFERFGPFNPDLIAVPDLEYWIRVASNTGLAVVPETLATFRVHPENASAVNARERGYHVNALDPLILMHQFAYHPAFSYLRARAVRRTPPFEFDRAFGESALRARRTPRRPTSEGSIGEWIEWKDLISRFPEMASSMPVRMAQLRMLRRRIRRGVARLTRGGFHPSASA